MIRILFVALICMRSLLADVAGCSPPGCNQAELENVNSRYTVEGFDFTGTARYKDVFARLSGELQDDLKKLIGQKFNQRIVDRLSQPM